MTEILAEAASKEHNKLIAQFMGKTVYPERGTKEYKNWKGKAHDYQWFELRYHESWDWLMPVVQKIINADMDTFDSYALWVSDSLRTADISQVYYSVVQYIINQPIPKQPVNQG